MENKWFDLIDDNIKNNRDSIYFVGSNDEHRRTGKTTALIKISLMYSIPIIVDNMTVLKFVNSTLNNNIANIINDIETIPTSTKLKYLIGDSLPDVAFWLPNFRGFKFENVILIEECASRYFFEIAQNATSNGIKIRGGFCRI